MEKYHHLAREVGKVWEVKVKVLPVVIGALGTVPRRLESFLSCMGVSTPAMLLGTCTARILRKVVKP